MDKVQKRRWYLWIIHHRHSPVLLIVVNYELYAFMYARYPFNSDEGGHRIVEGDVKEQERKNME